MPDFRRLLWGGQEGDATAVIAGRGEASAPPALTDDEHARLLEGARTAEGARYLTENVIGDPNQTFGIEIEFEGGNANTIARRLYDLGICSSPSQQRYHSTDRQPGLWTMERDGSVTGGEIVSPVMRDTQETWQQLKLVCDTIRECGGFTSANTGGHVNIGTTSSGVTGVKDLKRLVQLFAWSEDLLYRTGAAAGRYGAHRGAEGGNYGYCSPLSVNGAALQRVQAASTVHDVQMNVRGSGMQLSRFDIGDQSRVEFRYNDSSLDPERLQANIMIDCALMRSAATLSSKSLPDTPHLLGTHEASGLSGEDLLRDFARFVMRRPEERLKLYSVFARTEWQPRADRAQEWMQRRRRQHKQTLPFPLRYLPDSSEVRRAFERIVLG